MSNHETRIVFMGTPEFSVPSLDALVKAGYDVAAVVTQPDRPRGRGHRLSPSPVKQAAQSYGLPVIQMDKISSDDGLEAIKATGPDYIVTAAFGQILSQDLLDIPRKGTINVHASLLPAYRGASPIVRAVMNGEQRTGITTMYTVRAVDAGPMLLQESVGIGSAETAGELTGRLAGLGAQVLLKTLEGLRDGTIAPVEQDPDMVSYYPMFRHGYGEIDWSRPAVDVVNFVRALNPSPGAFFLLDGEKIRVLRAAYGGPSDSVPGTIVRADPVNGLIVAAGDGLVRLDEILRQGRRPMSSADSLRGRPISVGAVLGTSEGTGQ